MASLSPKETITAGSCAVLGWVIALLGALEIAYLSDASVLLDHSLALAVAALAGFCATLLFIVSRSRMETAARLALTGAAILGFLFLVFWGGLTVSCANGDCL